MSKLHNSVKAMNLHLFDGAASAGDGGASSASSADTGMSDSTTADDTQSAQGGVRNSTVKDKQDASASHQDIVVTSPDDERRTQWENYRRGEGKQYVDEYVQNIINKRFKETKTLESNAKLLAPMLKTLSTVYGIDSSNTQELVDAVLNDQRMYEERARENGVSVDVQMKFDKIQRENEELRATQEEQEQQSRTQQILDNWHNQADELKTEVPDFNFDYELENNRNFYDLVTHGIDVKTAYIASNPDNYARRVATQTEKKVTDNIRARGSRPSENGVSSNATATSNFDVSKLTPAQRRELANRASKGETITFR